MTDILYITLIDMSLILTVQWQSVHERNVYHFATVFFEDVIVWIS